MRGISKLKCEHEITLYGSETCERFSILEYTTHLSNSYYVPFHSSRFYFQDWKYLSEYMQDCTQVEFISSILYNVIRKDHIDVSALMLAGQPHNT